MVVTIKKNSKKEKIEDVLKKIQEAKKAVMGKGNIAHLFGSNPNEVDGMEFQKKVRNEWQ